MWRRWLVITVSLAGCNWAFGIKPTRELDAQAIPYFDSPIDAPFSCPPIGTTPVFTSPVRTVIAQDCSSYSISATTSTAVALCASTPAPLVMIGAVDQKLAVAPGLATDALHFYFDPKVSPEGDEVFVNRLDSGGTNYELVVFRLAGTAWVEAAPLPSPAFDLAGWVSAPTRGPNRHVIHRMGGPSGSSALYELVDDGNNTWTRLQPPYSPVELQAIFSAASPQLSPDGLRLLFLGAPLAMQSAPSIMYADRSSLGDRFSVARPLTSVFVDQKSDPYMNDDCSRIYLSTGPTLSFVQRQ